VTARASFLILVLSAQAGVLRAVDHQISSELWAEGYSIRAADGREIARRNIVEDLHMAVWNLLPGSADPWYDGPHLSVELNLQLGGDWGVERVETRRSEPGRYTPGLQNLDARAVFAFVSVNGLRDGAFDVRAGRQIRLDTIGFTAHDGVELVAHLPAGFALSSFIGREVQGGRPLGDDSLEMDGVDNGGRDDIDDAWFAQRTEPTPTLAFGSELSFVPDRHFDGAVAIRLLGLNGRPVARTWGGRLSTHHERIRSSLLVIANPLFDRRDDLSAAIREGSAVTEAEASIEVSPVASLWVGVEYLLYRPVFSADSIFNIFDLIPRRDLGLRAEQRLGERLTMAAWSYIRFEERSGGLTGHEADARVSGAGGGLGADYQRTVHRLSVRFNVQREWGAGRVGVETGGWRGLFDNRLLLGLRASFWHVDDALMGGALGNIAGWVMSARYAIASGAQVLGELENYFGGGQGPRLSALLILQLDLWK